LLLAISDIPTQQLSIRFNKQYTVGRVSFETSFYSKKLLALSEKKCLFRLFWFYTETEIFGFLIEPKQTEEQPKQFEREHILVYF
jgi:hypothetical protein